MTDHQLEIARAAAFRRFEGHTIRPIFELIDDFLRYERMVEDGDGYVDGRGLSMGMVWIASEQDKIRE